MKSLCDFGGNAPTLAFYSHIKTLLGRRPWFASKVTSGGIREQQSPVEIFVGISEVLVGIPGLVWPLEALKREQASQVTQLPDIILPLTATAGQLTRGDAPITPDTQSPS